jgi:hypothetical protein
VEQFGARCRREGFEASLEPRLHLVEVHERRLILRVDDGVMARGYASPSYNPRRGSPISSFPL